MIDEAEEHSGDETRARSRPLDGGAGAGRSDCKHADRYDRYLYKLIDHVERTKPDADVREVTVNDCRAFLDKWIDRSPSTQCSIHSALNGLFDWLYLEGEIDANPMLRIKRPRRLAARGRGGGDDHARGGREDARRDARAGRSSSASRSSPTWALGATPRAGCAGRTSTSKTARIASRREGRQVLGEADAVGAARDPPGGGRVGRGRDRPGRLRDPESSRGDGSSRERSTR